MADSDRKVVTRPSQTQVVNTIDAHLSVTDPHRLPAAARAVIALFPVPVVQPNLEDVTRAIHGAACCDLSDLRHEAAAAERVLALLAGRTEAEVKAEGARDALLAAAALARTKDEPDAEYVAIWLTGLATSSWITDRIEADHV